MKNVLLASVAFVFVSTSAAFAAMPAFDADPAVSTVVQNDFLVLAKDGGDNSGSGNSGSGSGDDSNSDDNDSDDNDDDSNDDNGGDRDDSASDDSNDDSPQSNSNRRKPRIPGGSGCDDAGDVAEHAECRAQ
jgi:opacity protein-like surface antigen